MILIIGKTGSGKDYIAHLLEKRGFSLLKSYSTRAKRSPEDDSHVFITDAEAEAYTDKIAEVRINGAYYFATAQQVKDNDIYVIDPSQAVALAKKLPHERFVIWYVMADEAARLAHAMERGNADVEREVFFHRAASEQPLFDEFDQQMLNGELPSNIVGTIVIQNP